MRRTWAVAAAILLPVAMATTVVSGPASAHPVRPYQAVDLGILGGGWAVAAAVNNRDEVAGTSSVGRDNHPFLWRRGVMTDLGFPGVGWDVNERGQVVGSAFDDSMMLMHAYLWDDGVVTDLTAPGMIGYTAEAVNDRGQVVGVFYSPEGDGPRGYLWDRGTMTDLGDIEPVDINNLGQVVANRQVDPYQRRAALWQRGRLTDLPLDSAAAINDRGWVAGTVASGSDTRAALWRSGVMTRLGTLGGGEDGPVAVNERGQVLGMSLTAEEETHAVLWQGRRTIDLTTRGIVLQTLPEQAVRGAVSDINDQGHIAATLATPPEFMGSAVLFR